MVLQQHDRVALVCTGSVSPHEDDAKKVKEFLCHKYNLEAVYDEHVYQWHEPKSRAEIFYDYLARDDIAMIWALRGGEGSADILPFLHQHHEKIAMMKPKHMMGFSDFTAILNYFASFYQWPVIHGLGALRLIEDILTPDTVQITMDYLFGQCTEIRLNELMPLNDLAKKPQHIVGNLVGGNLSLIDISINDLWQVDFSNQIVFLEDVNERAHFIIRTLKYFKRIGLFNGVKALVLGDFIGEKNISVEEIEAIDKVIHFFSTNSGFPVYKTNLFGHGKNNLPLIFNKEASIIVGDETNLIIKD